MEIENIIVAFSGLGVFLFALKTLTQSLDVSVSTRISPWIKPIDKGFIKPILAGLGGTVIFQASSISIITTMGILGRGLISFETAFYIMLGATIGTTLKSWFFASQLTLVGPILIIISALGPILTRENFKRKLFKTSMAIGLMFLGWKILGDGLKPISQMEWVTSWLETLNNTSFSHLLLAAAAGFLIAALLQSSSTTVFIVVGMATTGKISFLSGAAIILGANIGTTLTAILASLDYEPQVKRLALSHFFIKLIGVVMSILLFRTFLNTIDYLFSPILTDQSSVATRLAAVHTGFNVVNSLIWVALAPFMVKLTQFLIPDQKLPTNTKLTPTIKSILIQVPEQGLEEAHREWSNLVTRVKGFEDELFESFFEGEKMKSPQNYGHIKSTITGLEEILAGVAFQKNNHSKQAVFLLNKFSGLKLVFEDLENLKLILDGLPLKKTAYYGQKMKAPIAFCQRKSNEIWESIFFSKSLDSEKVTLRSQVNLREELENYIKNSNLSSKEEIHFLHKLYTLYMGHIQNLLSLGIQTYQDEKSDHIEIAAPTNNMPI